MAWKQRQVVKGLAMNPPLLNPLLTMPWGGYGNPALDAVIDEAMEQAGANDSARTGTSIHALTEWVDQGIEIDRENPDFIPFLPWVDKYVELTRGMKVLGIEKFVVQDDLQVAGTYDRFLELPEINVSYKPRGRDRVEIHIPAGTRVIGDIKTGKAQNERPWDTCLQVSTYANAKHFDVDTATRTPIEGVSLEWGLLIHIPSDDVTRSGVYLLDIAEGWAAALLALEVREWRKSKIIHPLDINHVEDSND
jgi:hypothetical protein